MARFFLSVLVGVALIATVSWAEEGKISKGKQLFTKHKCAACHTVKAQGIQKKADEAEEETKDAVDAKRKPPDLSGSGVDHDAAWLSKWLLKQEKVEGRLHRKKFRGTDEELKTISEWVASLKTDEAGKPKKPAAAAKVEKAAPAEKAEPAENVEPAEKAAPAEKVEPAEKAAPADSAEPAEKTEGAK